jgi:hypothetical protein
MLGAGRASEVGPVFDPDTPLDLIVPPVIDLPGGRTGRRELGHNRGAPLK